MLLVSGRVIYFLCFFIKILGQIHLWSCLKRNNRSLIESLRFNMVKRRSRAPACRSKTKLKRDGMDRDLGLFQVNTFFLKFLLVFVRFKDLGFYSHKIQDFQATLLGNTWDFYGFSWYLMQGILYHSRRAPRNAGFSGKKWPNQSASM